MPLLGESQVNGMRRAVSSMRSLSCDARGCGSYDTVLHRLATCSHAVVSSIVFVFQEYGLPGSPWGGMEEADAMRQVEKQKSMRKRGCGQSTRTLASMWCALEYAFLSSYEVLRGFLEAGMRYEPVSRGGRITVRCSTQHKPMCTRPCCVSPVGRGGHLVARTRRS